MLPNLLVNTLLCVFFCEDDGKFRVELWIIFPVFYFLSRCVSLCESKKCKFLALSRGSFFVDFFSSFMN